MGFEGSFSSKMQEVRRNGSSLKSAKHMEVSSGHKRSKSFPDKIAKEDSLDNSSGVSCRSKLDMGQMKDQVELQKKLYPKTELQKKLYPKTELQSSLKKEIVHLEKRLDDQFVVRTTLEKALGCRSSFRDSSNENSMSKPANELIKEIAVLELEVVYLEQYLLSLYRRAFNQRICSVSPSTTNERVKSPPIVEKEMCIEVSGQDIKSKREPPEFQFSQPLVSEDSFACSPKEMQITNVRDQLLDSGIHRCHSELSQRSACPTRTTTENLDRAIRSCHSQPLSYMEQSTTPYVISLAEHLGTRIADHVPQTPNKISEDMIKCMSAIYCKLSDPPLMNHSSSFSPNSSFSSVSELSPPDQFDIWSPWYRKESSFDAQLVNPFHVESFREFSGPYSTMVEVPSICKDSQRLKSIDPLLQNYRSLVSLLEEVDPRRMKHEERLAFWINTHNALVMHTFLAYGIPQNNLKRVSLFLKAAYNVGGHTISVETIQGSILGCRMSRPGQWLRLLFSPRTKFKTRDDRQSYAIEHPEPLLHFALCSGSHSDPAVRVYTPKRVIQELDTAREEYIRAMLSVRKEQKLVLPKIIESFAKESGLCQVGLVEMIRNFVPDTLWKTMQQGSQQWKSHKNIEWVPHNFAFRYLISKELVR